MTNKKSNDGATVRKTDRYSGVSAPEDWQKMEWYRDKTGKLVKGSDPNKKKKKAKKSKGRPMSQMEENARRKYYSENPKGNYEKDQSEKIKKLRKDFRERNKK